MKQITDLFVRMRSYDFAKDTVQRFKLKNTSVKKPLRSLQFNWEIITINTICHYHHHNQHHLSLSSQSTTSVTIIITINTICQSLSSSQPPPSITIIITTTTIYYYHHHNHHHLSLSSSELKNQVGNVYLHNLVQYLKAYDSAFGLHSSCPVESDKRANVCW